MWGFYRASRSVQSNDEDKMVHLHENTGQIKLYLETDIDIGSIDGRRPPHGKSSIGYLRQTRSLGIGL